MKRTLVTILAVLLISAMPAVAGDIARWQCGKTVVQVYVEYSPENSMGGDSPEPIYTLRFENPPKGHDHDTRALQAWLGHKNIQHTVRYTELAPDRFRDFWR